LVPTAYCEAQPIIQEKKVFSWIYELLEPGAKMEFIFRHHFQQLNFLVGRIVDSATESEDIVMKVIYKVVATPRQPKTHEHLKRKLFVSMRNEAISYLRYRKTHQKAVSYLSNSNQSLVYPSVHLSDQDKENIWQKVSEEIRRLPPQRKKILQLYFFENKNTKEISELLSLSKQTILNQKARALEYLRKSDLKDIWRNLVEP
jgi:RNA polymerase sigma-70 factor (ECF subfamily)